MVYVDIHTVNLEWQMCSSMPEISVFYVKNSGNDTDCQIYSLLSDLKVKSNCVDGGAGATGVILEGSSEKSLGEKEAANPENRWNAVMDPSLQEIDPLKQI